MESTPSLVLVVSNATDVTADFLFERLERSGARCARLNTELLAELSIDFEVGGESPRTIMTMHGECRLDEIRSIYYRRPVTPQIPGRVPSHVRVWMESELRQAWGGVLHSVEQRRWVNHPLSISAASYKPEQLLRAARVGMSVPPALLTNREVHATAFCDLHDWNVIVKPIGHGEILGANEDEDYLIYTNELTELHRGAFTRIKNCPTLFQRKIDKLADVRVTVVGELVIAVELKSQEQTFSRIDCRRENMRGMRYSRVSLPQAVETSLVRLVKSYDLVFGAIDLVVDAAGVYWFLELNPAGQWAWLDQCAGSDIAGALVEQLVG